MASNIVDRLRGVKSSQAIKVPCLAATTANITLSGEQTIDGVLLIEGDRVLVKDQDTASENGIWECDTGAWERAPDWDGVGDVVSGTRVYVSSGTLNRGEWVVTTANPIVIGTTSVALTSGPFDASINTSDDIIEGVVQKFVRHWSDITALGGTWQGGRSAAGGVKIGAFAAPDAPLSDLGGTGTARGYIAIGDGAMFNATGGRSIIAIGRNALGISETPGFANLAIGEDALAHTEAADFETSPQEGTRNVGLGTLTGFFNTSGKANVWVGRDAGHSNTTGDYRIAIGYFAGTGWDPIGLSDIIENHAPTTAEQDVLIGYQAGQFNNGDKSVMIGTWAGRQIKDGLHNTILGGNAGDELDEGLWYDDKEVTVSGATGTYSQTGTVLTISITSHGATAGEVVAITFTSGDHYDDGHTDVQYLVVTSVTDPNVFVLTSPTSETASGNCTLVSTVATSTGTSSSRNVLLGWGALSDIVTANRTVAIGYAAGADGTFGGGTTLADMLIIGTQATGVPLIVGDFANGYVSINGDATDLTVPFNVFTRAGVQLLSLSATGELNTTTNLITNGNVRAGASGAFYWNGLAQFRSPADGDVSIRNAANSAYGRLLADSLDVTDGITAPGTTSGRAKIYVDTADGDLKIKFGDGTVKTIVVDT